MMDTFEKIIVSAVRESYTLALYQIYNICYRLSHKSPQKGELYYSTNVFYIQYLSSTSKESERI